MSRRCILRSLPAVLAASSALQLGGCALRPHLPATARPAAGAPAPHEGAPYEIVAGESLLAILVYRGGALASAGHNHVIASHQLHGTVYVPADRARASFEVHIPLETLTVDEKELRARELSPDFPPDVPDSARQGTRRNMLGPTLLDAEHFPEIVLRALGLDPQPRGRGANAAADSTGELLAHVECTLRGQSHAVAVPLSYRLEGARLHVSGEFPLRQSELGLTPFTAMLGALAVQDEMRVRVDIVAQRAPPGAT